MWNINNFPVYHKQECEYDIFHQLHLTYMLFPHIVLLLSDLAEVVTILTCILDVPSLNLGQGTDYPYLNFFFVLPQALHANAGILCYVRS
jgi:hypothetical protein